MDAITKLVSRNVQYDYPRQLALAAINNDDFGVRASREALRDVLYLELQLVKQERQGIRSAAFDQATVELALEEAKRFSFLRNVVKFGQEVLAV